MTPGFAIAVVVAVALAAISVFFVYIILKTMIVVPLRALANIGGLGKVTVDPRISSRAHLRELRQFTRDVSAHTPQIPTTKVQYKSILGFIPYAKVPYFHLDDKPYYFFDSHRVESGSFSYQRLTPNEMLSEFPLIEDIETLQKPAGKTIEIMLGEALAIERNYPQTGIATVGGLKAPLLNQFIDRIDIGKPTLNLPLWRGPLTLLNGFVRNANKDRIAEYRNALKGWRELQLEYDEAWEHLRQTRAALDARVRSSEIARENDRAEWETRQREEFNLLQSTLDSWRAGYNIDPGQLAKLVLEFTLFPRWLPINVASSFDAASGVLIVDAQFPDIGQLSWQRKVGDKLKPCTKSQTKEANERLYPALAVRYAWEIARAANHELVKTVVLNGWADYIDRATGETKRAYVTSLLADIFRLRALNLPAVDVVQAFTSLKGISARAQTVTPVAPIVAIDTNDRRFVDARNVMDGMSSEQNLATNGLGRLRTSLPPAFRKRVRVK